MATGRKPHAARSSAAPRAKVVADPQPGADPAIRVVMMPRDTNAWGTIFGGIILSHIDQAGAVEAHRRGCRRVVTVAMNQVEFHQPVFVGDLVSYYASVLRIGRTSIHVQVVVQAERGMDRAERVLVTQAEVVYVHVGEDGHPLAIPQSRAVNGSRRRRSHGR